MLNRRYPILISGTRYSPEFHTELQYAVHWKSVLEKAYGNHATCQCPSSGARKLSIKRREGATVFIWRVSAEQVTNTRTIVASMRQHRSAPVCKGMRLA